MITRIEIISPKKAAQWLENNPSNRPIRKKHVLFLSKQMAAGEWQVTHQGIAFDENGNLCDGQHRLAAIVKSGIAVEMMVTQGVARGKFTAFDTGVGRTISDVTGVHRRVIEVVNVLVGVAKEASLSYKVMPQEALRFCDIFKPELDEMCLSNTSCRATTRATIRAAAVLATAQGNLQAISKYRSLSLLNFEEMKPIVCSLARYLISSVPGGGSTIRAEEFTKAVWAFQDKNSTTEKLYVRDVNLHMHRISDEINELILQREGVAA